MAIALLTYIGRKTIEYCTIIGQFTLFLVQAIITLLTTRLKLKQLFIHMEHIGVAALSIIFLTGSFTGAVLALQTYIGFKRFGAEEFIGTVVALSLTRELGPVLTGLMIAGRSGSSMAAELGTMRITEQIDALQTLCINRFQYLIVPRILASSIVMPCLSAFAMLCGIAGGYYIAVYVFDQNAEDYISGIRTYIELSDITGGLIKSSVFGLILAWVGTYCGYTTHGGARGVGRATTQAVVIGSILILIANYFLTAMLFETGLG